MDIIIIIAITVFILYKLGVFNKPGTCVHCNKSLKGTEQKLIGDKKIVLCKACYKQINHQILNCDLNKWDLDDVKNYFAWAEEMKKIEGKFNIDYAYEPCLKIDKENGLFTIDDGPVYRFSDVLDFDINFKPEKVEEGFLGDKVKGNEYISIELLNPNIYLESFLKCGVKLKLTSKGIINTKYEYELTSELTEAFVTFAICVAIFTNPDVNKGFSQKNEELTELQKALALFMFDNIEEVTEEEPKQQRNSLIKAFHPDNKELNETYAQKINAAYEIIKKNMK